MRSHVMLAILAGTLGVSGSAAAQDTNIRTETQERLRQGDVTKDALNWLGIIGLVGLLGLKRGHDEDSYHPSDMD
jgi:hypothetical protein